MLQQPSGDPLDGQATVLQTEKAIDTRDVERRPMPDGIPAELDSKQGTLTTCSKPCGHRKTDIGGTPISLEKIRQDTWGAKSYSAQ